MSEFFKTAATLHALEKLGESERIQDRHNRTIDDQNSRIADLEEQLRRARVQDNYLPAPSGREMDLERRVQELESIEFLLSRPMAEIAQRIPAFKDTYLKEREIFAQCILAQKAFAEIAMQYGQALGKTPDQVTSEARQTQELVKDGHSKFGNNLDAEIKGVLGYTQKTQDKRNEVQRKADEENLRDFERVLENWRSVEKQRELSAEDKGKIEKIQNKINEFKEKLGLS